MERYAEGVLSLINGLTGTPHEIDFTGKLVCIEDVEEAPYRIDRMLTQIKNFLKLTIPKASHRGISPVSFWPKGPKTVPHVRDYILPHPAPTIRGRKCSSDLVRSSRYARRMQEER